MQAERIDCKENPIQAFNNKLFMLDRVVAECSLACRPVLFPLFK